MAKHSDGKQNYRIARGPLLVLLSLIIVLALALGWWNLRSDTATNRADEKACPAGDVTLPIAADPAMEQRVKELVEKYRMTNPVVHEQCVQPEVTAVASTQTLAQLTGSAAGSSSDAGADANRPAVWVPAGTAFGPAAKEAGAAIETKGPDAASVIAGFAIAPEKADEFQKLSWEELGKLKIAAPAGPDAAVAGAVLAAAGVDEAGAEQAAKLGAGKDANALFAAVGKDFDAVPATQEQASASHLAFAAPEELNVPGPVLALTPSEHTSEIQARAAQNFTEFAHKSGYADVDNETAPHNGALAAKLTQAVDKGAAAFSNKPGTDSKSGKKAEQVKSTLFLVDTSGSMGLIEGNASRMEHTQQIAGEELAKAGRDGARVGLWNYSSPQSPGVTQPWRDNIPLSQNDDGSASAASLRALGFAGATWTYQSVIAAMASATEAYVDGGTNRIILLTDGPDDSGMSVDDFMAQLKQVQDPKRPVQVDVVLLGEKADKAVYEKLTTETGGELHSAATSDAPAFADALRQAFEG